MKAYGSKILRAFAQTRKSQSFKEKEKKIAKYLAVFDNMKDVISK